MSNPAVDKVFIEKFGPYSRFIGFLLILLGAVGILLPAMMSLSTAIFVGWLLLAGGILWAVHTYKHSPKHVMDWLKPVLLLIVGGMMLFYPVGGVEVVSLLLAVYLLLDALCSFTLVQSMHPTKGWGWMVFNGVASIVIVAFFLIGWPVTSLWLVGLYVGINLLFNGLALVAIGWSLRKTGTTGSP